MFGNVVKNTQIFVYIYIPMRIILICYHCHLHKDKDQIKFESATDAVWILKIKFHPSNAHKFEYIIIHQTNRKKNEARKKQGKQQQKLPISY